VCLVPVAPKAGAGQWHFARGNQRFGPFSQEQMVELSRTGKLLPLDHVWTEGMPQWVVAGTVATLFPPQGRDAALEPILVDAESVTAEGKVPPAGPGFWLGLWTNLWRALSWDLRSVRVTARERESLLSSGVDSEAAQAYLAWRRSVFLLVIPVTTVSFLLSIIRMAKQQYTGVTLTPLGVLTEALPILTQLSMPIAALLAYVFWLRVRLSRRLLVVTWLVAFLLPLGIGLIPASWQGQVHVPGPPEAQQAMDQFVRVFAGLYYFVTLMPTILALLPGVLRACVRMKGLLPESFIPGWILVAGSPLYILLVLVTFILINHLVGNVLLMLGLLMLIGAPGVYLCSARLFIRPLFSEHDRRRLWRVQWLYTTLSSVASVLLIVFAATAQLFGRNLVGFDSKTAFFLPWNIIQFYVEVVGRSLFTTVVFSELIMLLNSSVWLRFKEFAASSAAQPYDQLVRQLEESMKK
jgi:hypothetical protein